MSKAKANEADADVAYGNQTLMINHDVSVDGKAETVVADGGDGS